MAKKLKDFVSEARSQIEEITPDDVDRLRSDKPDLLILDVREPGEYEAGHLRDALNVPRGVLEPAADPDYKKPNPTLSTAYERPVAVYCATGGRSALAVKTLNEMGFKEVYNLGGGYENWEAEDRETVTD